MIKEHIKNMRITNIVQTGFLNVPTSKMLAEFGNVLFLSESKFDPFKDETNIELIVTNVNNYAYGFKKKHGILDVCFFGHCTCMADTRASICAWVPEVRKNALLFFKTEAVEETLEVINDYIGQVDPSLFEVTSEDSLVIVKVL